MQGKPKSLVIQVPPSHIFVCYRFSLIQGSQIAIRLKGKANSAQKPKSFYCGRDQKRKMQEIPKSLVIWEPPYYVFVCYRFFNSGQPNRYKIKKAKQTYKNYSHSTEEETRNAKLQGIPKSLVIWVPPSYMFVLLSFL